MQRCLGCMREFSEEFEICPYCGYIVGSDAASKNHLSPGTVLQDRYILGKVLGQGGFGITYIAWDKKIGRAVAVKEYMPNAFASRITGEKVVSCFNAQAQQQFNLGLEKTRKETQALSRFGTLESVVKVYDFIEENKTAYIIMELLRGKTVKEILSERGKLTFAQTIRIMTPVLQTLDAMHKVGMIHRDVAPDNIFVCEDGKIKLLDFGAARVVSGTDNKTLSIMLKAGYAPVEQYSGKSKQGAFTDVYAASATMYKMLTGETPPDSLSREAGDNELQTALSKTDAPPAAKKTILRGMARTASDRIQTVQQLLEQLQEKPHGKYCSTCPDVFKKSFLKKKSSKRIAVVAACMVAVALFAAFIYKFGSNVIVGNKTIHKDNTVPAAQSGQDLPNVQNTEKQSDEEIEQSYENVRIGDTISFGKYEQDNNDSNGKEELEWIVLDKQKDRILVITKYCIDQSSYHCDKTEVTWQDCTLRQWMNITFKNHAFSYFEQQRIIPVSLQNEDNPQYGTDGGLDTTDGIFALSISQVKEYFSSDEQRRGVATAFTKANGAFVGDSYGTSWWWLRTPGESQTRAALVDVFGKIIVRGGESVNINNDAIRPAMWISTNADTSQQYSGSIANLLRMNGSELSADILQKAADVLYNTSADSLFENNPSLATETLKPYYSDSAIQELIKKGISGSVLVLYPLSDQSWIETTCRIQSFDERNETAILQVICKKHLFFELDKTGQKTEEWDGTWQSIPQEYLDTVEGLVAIQFENTKWKVDSCKIYSQ